jgi:enamine deaminase RidA (YjgF/YER057c/UK114 family)
MTETPHRIVNPEGLPAPVGYAHAVVAAPGRLIFVGGQVGERPEGVPDGLPDQMDLACASVVTALHAAGAAPEHLVSLQIFTTDVEGYKRASKEIGRAYRRHFGKHYPAMALLGVTRLFEPAAKIELVATAVVPANA